MKNLISKKTKRFFCIVFAYLVFFILPKISQANSGDIAIYRDSFGGDLFASQAWDTTEREDTAFAINPDRATITLQEEGHYFVAYNLALESTGGNNRSEIQGFLNLFGDDLSYGRSTGYIRRTEGADEAFLAGSAIIDANAGDGLVVGAMRTDSNLGAGVGRRANESGVSLLKLDDAWDYARIKDNIGGYAFNFYDFSPIVWDTDDELDAGSFSRSGENIFLKQTGHYLITANVKFFNISTNARRNNEIRLTLDDLEIPGTRTTAYLRGTNSTQEHTAVWTGIIETMTDNQILKLESACEGEDCGGVFNTGDGTAITIVKLPDNANYLRLSELGGGQSINGVYDPIFWDTGLEVDADFSYAGDDSITYIQTAGDYLFFGSFYSYRDNTNNSRLYPHWEWFKSGSEKQRLGSFGKYNRGNQSNTGTFSAGNSGAIILNNLSGTDYVEIINTNETDFSDTSAIFPAERIGLQAVNISSLFGSVEPEADLVQKDFRWRNDDIALNTDGSWLADKNLNINNISKSNAYRLRVSLANLGRADSMARKYVLQWADKEGLASCGDVVAWSHIGSGGDFVLKDSSFINLDGENISASFLPVSGMSLAGGQGRDVSGITDYLGPLGANQYLELEYNIKANSLATAGHDYCFRIFDFENNTVLNDYENFPELTIEKVNFDMPVLEWGYQDNVGDDSWTTINFANDYSEPIFLCQLNYANNIGAETDGTADSVVCRVQNVGPNSAQVRLQQTGQISDTLNQNEKIYWAVAEAGSYTDNNFKMEAFKYNSTFVDENNSWIGESQQYDLSYSNPIVLGQVMSYNDPRWSVFWSRGANRKYPADQNYFYTGRHVGEDIDTSRNEEEVGVVVFEATHDFISGIEYEVGLTSKSIDRIDDNPPQTYFFDTSFINTPEVGILAQSGINGADGPLPVFYGLNPLAQVAINISIMEDEIADTEQKGNLEYSSYLVFERAGSHKLSYNLDQTTFRFFENIDSLDPTSAIAGENAIIDNVGIGNVFRLRMSLQAGEDLDENTQAFKLQYGQGQNCSEITTWQDVGDAGSMEAWRGYDNPSIQSKIQIGQSLLDYENNFLESYSEQGVSAKNFSNSLGGTRGEWDWVIENYNAVGQTDYCFRMVTFSGASLQYTNYPKVSTGESSGSLDILTNTTANLDNISFSFNSQNSQSSDLGVINAKDSRGGSPGWTVNITGEDWVGLEGIMDYDGDGSSTGQLTVDLTSASIFANQGATNGLNIGITDSFDDTTKVINLITALSGFGTGDFNIENVILDQLVPAGQKSGIYNMTLVFTIS